MKRFVLVLSIVVVIIGICVYSLFYVGRTKKEIEAYTGAVFAAMNAGDSSTLADTVSGLYDYWHRAEKGLVLFVRHGQIDEISNSMFKLRSYTQNKEYVLLHAEVSLINEQMTHLYQAERPLPGNIL